MESQGAPIYPNYAMIHLSLAFHDINQVSEITITQRMASVLVKRFRQARTVSQSLLHVSQRSITTRLIPSKSISVVRLKVCKKNFLQHEIILSFTLERHDAINLSFICSIKLSFSAKST